MTRRAFHQYKHPSPMLTLWDEVGYRGSIFAIHVRAKPGVSDIDGRVGEVHLPNMACHKLGEPSLFLTDSEAF